MFEQWALALSLFFLATIAVSMSVGWLQERLAAPIMSSAPAPVMSSAAPQPVVAPSVSQTDGAQTQTPEPTKAEQLALYRQLRLAGMPREAARELLRPFGIPLDNNAWAAAAPPLPQPLTPFAGRPYNPADYHADSPELQYKPPG